MHLKYFTAFFLLLTAFWWYLSPTFYTLPKPTGTYQVGTVSYELCDDTNNFMIRCWYPANSTSENKSPSYGEPKQNAWNIKEFATKTYIPQIFLSNAFNLTIDSKLAAPLSSNSPAYPVIIFLPGFKSSYNYYEALLSQLASHGYIIVAINTSSVQLISFPDGRFIEPDQDKLAEKIPLIVQNASCVIHWLTLTNTDTNSMWHKHINLKKIFVMGHSIGGSAAVIMAQEDKRIAAGINLDGWIEMQTIKTIPVPFLFMLNDTDFPPGKDMGLLEIKHTCALSSNRCEICIIPNAGHNSFFDLAFLKWPFNKAGDPGKENPYTILETIENKILHFLNSK